MINNAPFSRKTRVGIYYNVSFFRIARTEATDDEHN